MLPSGYLARPCEGGGSIIHIVDHVDLDVRKIFYNSLGSTNLDVLFGLIALQTLVFGLECSWGSQAALLVIKDDCSENDHGGKNYLSSKISPVVYWSSPVSSRFLLYRPWGTFDKLLRRPVEKFSIVGANSLLFCGHLVRGSAGTPLNLVCCKLFYPFFFWLTNS